MANIVDCVAVGSAVLLEFLIPEVPRPPQPAPAAAAAGLAVHFVLFWFPDPTPLVGSQHDGTVQ